MPFKSTAVPYRNGPCAVPGCPNLSRIRGYCDKHYRRLWVHGDAMVGEPSWIAQEFWKFVEQSDGCWLWTGKTLPSGYGRFRKRYAHRFAWELVNGPIPKGLYVCHHCDVPSCCRPDHLFLGTALENNLDSEAKGRSAARRLPAAEVRRIRHRYAQGGVSIAALSREFGIDYRRTWKLVHGDSYRWVESDTEAVAKM